MRINAKTKISELVRYNKDSIEAIASLSKPLRKLKNPVLRKVMASRVTLAEAAKIGKSSMEEFAVVLKPLGFIFEEKKTEAQQTKEIPPTWLDSLSKDKIDFFDVRSHIEEGNDPLKEIMQRFKKVKNGEALCIINSFIPTPLVRRLEKNNVLSYTEKIESEVFYTYFFKAEESKPLTEKQEGAHVIKNSKEDFENIFAQFDSSQIKTLDVRHLEMPMPMQTILKALPDLANNEVLYIHHKRIPIYLLEEIADRDFTVHLLQLDEDNVKMLIYHKK